MLFEAFAPFIKVQSAVMSLILTEYGWENNDYSLKN